MGKDFDAGQKVRLISVPDWLVHDLPASEKEEILRCVGGVVEVESIDDFGYYWVGFGITKEVEQDAHYSGHSFCVPRDCLEST